jgi:hypothetical protein
MTRAPWVIDKPGTPWAKPGAIYDTALGWRFTNPRFTAADREVPPGAGPEVVKMTLATVETAEDVAARDGITRDESDAFALRSHQRASAAWDAGRFAREIVPVRDGEFSRDECVRPSTTTEKLGTLRTVFRKDGVVTAGSSFPLSDGAAALVVASEAAVERYGLTPRARIVTSAAAGVAPNLMGLTNARDLYTRRNDRGVHAGRDVLGVERFEEHRYTRGACVLRSKHQVRPRCAVLLLHGDVRDAIAVGQAQQTAAGRRSRVDGRDDAGAAPVAPTRVGEQAAVPRVEIPRADVETDEADLGSLERAA